MKRILFVLLSCGMLVSITAKSQTVFNMPQNIVLTTKEDYVNYENDIINAAKWLEETPLNSEIEKRKEITAFVVTWISGSPNVSVMIHSNLTKLYGKNLPLLGIYLASYARHFLENKETATTFSGNKAALISMMTVYKKGINIEKNKEMEKLIKLSNSNKLDAYVKTKLS